MSSNELGILFYLKLNAVDLEQIHKAFQNTENELHDEFMDKDTFCRIVSSALSKGSQEELSGLFDTIDISREGKISWDRMCNHLLLEYYEKEDRIKASEIPQWQDLKCTNNPHKDFINRIMFYPTTTSRYVSVSKDGMLCILDDNCNIKRTHQIQTNNEEMRLKDLWITDAVILPNFNKIAFSTTSKQVWIYDISNKQKFICQYKILGFKYITLCLTYWSDPDDINQSIMVVGDTNGDVYIFFFSATNVSLFNKPLKNDNSQDVCFQVQLNDVFAGLYHSVSCYTYHGHSTWVRQIYFVSILDCFITCSTNSLDSIVLAWLGKSRKDVRLTNIQIPPGINCFDYHAKSNLIATAGIDNNIHLWNPYVVSKPVGVLKGHMHSVVGVCFTPSKGQLLSLSKDKVLRVWDVNLKICLQRLNSVFPKSVESKIFMYYDQAKACLLTSVNNQLYTLKRKAEIKDRIVSHNAAVMDFVYNEKFGQMISVSDASEISIWFLSTGQKVKHIQKAHGKSELTAVTIDHTATRILTAGTDGIVKIWDMNGICYHELIVENGNPCEITQILCFKRMILATGWSKIICHFLTSQMKSYQLEPIGWKGKRQHMDDILVADFMEPRTLVTASYDGDIVFWNTNTENSTRKIVTDPFSTKNRTTLPPLRISPMPRKSRLTASRESRRSEFDSEKNIPRVNTVNTQPCIAVTSIKFLKTRNSHDPRTADLYSCHSNGSIRFWNSLTCEKIIEFDCFDTFGEVVSCIDNKDTYLGVGGESGVCKIFNIKDYAVNHENNLNFNQTNSCYTPVVITTYQVHLDAITCIQFVEHNDVLLVLSSSIDHSIALHCYGHLVGVFGQKDHWNINDDSVLTLGRASLVESQNEKLEVLLPAEEEINVNQDTPFNSDTQSASSRSTTDGNDDKIPIVITSDYETSSAKSILSFKVEDAKKEAPYETSDNHQTWDKTVLGRSYQEQRRAKRSRKQPYGLDSLTTEIPIDKQNHSYRYLKTNEISETANVTKPDFVTHPGRYFLDDTEDMKPFLDDIPVIVDQLKLRHDDKSVFPKFILEMETKMKTAHTLYKKPLGGVFSRLSSQNSTRVANRGLNNKFIKSTKWKQLSEDVASKVSSVTELSDFD